MFFNWGQTGLGYLRKIDPINRMIPVTVIPLSGLHCNSEMLLEASVVDLWYKRMFNYNAHKLRIKLNIANIVCSIIVLYLNKFYVVIFGLGCVKIEPVSLWNEAGQASLFQWRIFCFFYTESNSWFGKEVHLGVFYIWNEKVRLD